MNAKILKLIFICFTFYISVLSLAVKMMEEEEDVVFDRAGLLTNRVKSTTHVRTSGNTASSGRGFKTAGLCAAFFGLVC